MVIVNTIIINGLTQFSLQQILATMKSTKKMQDHVNYSKFSIFYFELLKISVI